MLGRELKVEEARYVSEVPRRIGVTLLLTATADPPTAYQPSMELRGQSAPLELPVHHTNAAEADCSSVYNRVTLLGASHFKILNLRSTFA